MSPGDSNDPPNDRVDQPAVIQMDSRDTTGSLTDHHWVGWLARSTRAEPPVIQEVLKPNHTRTIRWLRPRSTSRKMNRRTSAYPIVSPLHPSLEFPGLASRSYRIRPSLEVLFDHLALIWKIRLVGGRALRSSPPPGLGDLRPSSGIHSSPPSNLNIVLRSSVTHSSPSSDLEGLRSVVLYPTFISEFGERD